jgi:hypothetical protein
MVVTVRQRQRHPRRCKIEKSVDAETYQESGVISAPAVMETRSREATIFSRKCHILLDFYAA